MKQKIASKIRKVDISALIFCSYSLFCLNAQSTNDYASSEDVYWERDNDSQQLISQHAPVWEMWAGRDHTLCFSGIHEFNVREVSECGVKYQVGPSMCCGLIFTGQILTIIAATIFVMNKDVTRLNTRACHYSLKSNLRNHCKYLAE